MSRTLFLFIWALDPIQLVILWLAATLQVIESSIPEEKMLNIFLYFGLPWLQTEKTEKYDLLTIVEY